MADSKKNPSENNPSEENEDEHDLESPLVLDRAEYLTKLENKSFKDLDYSLQLNFKRSRLHIFILKKDTDPKYKYEVFKRLNTGGALLTKQEIRNCNARLFNQDETFVNFLTKMAQEENFSACIDLDRNAQDAWFDELVLRFFALKNSSDDKITDSIETALDEYMEQASKGKISFDYSNEQSIFEKTFQLLKKAFEDENAFVGRTNEGKACGPFSNGLFEMVSVGLAHNLRIWENQDPLTLKEKIIDLIKSAKTKKLTGQGATEKNAKKRRLERLKHGQKFLSSSNLA